MRESVPGEKPIEDFKTPNTERGNKQQWEQELGGRASLTKIERGGKLLRVVAAEHFSEQVVGFFQEDINGEILNPKEWYFLIEGKDTDVHECEIARKIAEEKKIPIEDPVLDPFHPEVIRLYLASARAGKISREILIGQMGATLENAKGTMDLEEISAVLGVANSQELYSNIYLAAAEKNKDPEGYLVRSKQMFDDLTEISNLVSAQVLDYYLRQNPTRKHVALYLGISHEGIIKMDLSQIPDNLRFSDQQIKDLLDRRERTEFTRILRTFGIKLSEGEEIPPAIEPTTQREETRTGGTPNRKTRIVEVLSEMADMPDSLRNVIEKWSDNLFGLKDINRERILKYLNSESSLCQIWGAAALLAEKVDVAQLENREMTSEEVTEVEKAFFKAAGSRRKYAVSEGNELEELSKGIKVLAKVIQRLNFHIRA